MKTSLYRHRLKQFPPLPTSRASITIPDSLKSTLSGQPFLMEAAPNNDYLLFCSPHNLVLLCSADVIAMDGTFDACPPQYSGGQMFTIHAFEQGKLLPLVYCLASTKSREFYVSVFDTLKREALRIGLVFNPTTVLSDFESGLIPAVAASFPQATHRGCHFHFCQAIYRNVQRLGLVGAYESQPEIRLQVRQLMALAFLPIAIVRLTFSNLEAQSDPLLQPLFQYFRQQWLTAVPTRLWNVSGEDIRTNNDCEGWHVRFNNAINKHHPNIWKFLACLLNEQASVEVVHQQLLAGRRARRHNSKYVSVQKRLRTLKARYDNGRMSAIDYITGVSHNLAERH